jgi:hypothetical protein
MAKVADAPPATTTTEPDLADASGLASAQTDNSPPLGPGAPLSVTHDGDEETDHDP